MTGVVSLTLIAVLIIVHVGHGVRHDNINSVYLEDTSFPLNTGDSVPCGGQVDMRNSTTRHFQTPNYPLKYPRGKAGRCSWTFILPPNPKIVCEKFHVQKRDRLCIRIKNGATFKRKQCYYGMKSESFSFPLHDVSSSAFSNESTIKMVFWPNQRRSGHGFKCAVVAGVTTGCRCGIEGTGSRIVGGMEISPVSKVVNFIDKLI